MNLVNEWSSRFADSGCLMVHLWSYAVPMAVFNATEFHWPSSCKETLLRAVDFITHRQAKERNSGTTLLIWVKDEFVLICFDRSANIPNVRFN